MISDQTRNSDRKLF